MRYGFFPLAALTLLLPAVSQAADPGIEFFEKKIRPVLIEHCYACHSAEAQKNKKLKGGLFLDSREGVRKGGDNGAILVSGKPKESLLIKALQYDGAMMPPKGKLPDTVIADFVKWVELGAPDPRDGTTQAARTIDIDAGKKHWAYRPLTVVEAPTVKDTARVRTPVDRFILAALEKNKLTLNNPVSRERLLRRVTFDLIGLPPTPEEIEAFVKDTDPKAYEKVVDRLLASERFGERWARHWLDVVRYAESGGYEFDKDRPGAYHYRDFVIQAFNRDLPYDEFVRLQVGGDRLKPDDVFSTTATGFLVAGPYPGQTTVRTQALIRYDHLDDMVSTLGSAFLGLTMGCARCHDHKFDPIPQKDYAHLVACMGRTDSVETKMDTNPEATRKAKAEFDAVHAPLVATRDKFEKDQLPGRLEKWLQTQPAESPRWLALEPLSVIGKATYKTQANYSVLVSGKSELTDVVTFTAQTYRKGITAIRLEALTDPSLPKNGPGRGPDGTFMLTEINITATSLNTGGKPAKSVPVKLKAIKASAEVQGFALAAALDKNVTTGWSAPAGQAVWALFETEGDLGFPEGTSLRIALEFAKGSLGHFRLSLSTAARSVAADGEAVAQHAPELAQILRDSKSQITDANRAIIRSLYRRFDEEANRVNQAVDDNAKKEPQPKLTPVFVATSGRGGEVHYLIRGEVERKNGVARTGFVQVLENATEGETRWLGTPGKQPAVDPRIALGNWLTDDKHGAGHLVARVMVNRLWQHHFGKGLVRTPNDFGTQGEPPTHPELLDWLAGELIRSGWKLKAIHKLLVTSAVYMQGGEVMEPGNKTDPQNRLWWRMPSRRLEAEIIRDALLAVSDTLEAKLYGPSTLDENSNRRSVYLTVKRSKHIPLLQIFDAPEAIQSVGERQTTTVATQALAMMNSPFVRQRAEKLAAKIKPKSLEEVPTVVDRAYLITLGRKPVESEREKMVKFIKLQTETTGAKNLDAAVADFCQVLLCLNEFVYVD